MDEEEKKVEIARNSPPPESVCNDEQKMSEERDIKHLYNYELGFTKVIEALMKNKKPIIGHNMLYDIGFIYRMFLSANGNLPPTYEDFVKSWKTHFPHPLYDTKVLSASCGSQIFSKTDLKTILENCKNDKRLRNNVQLEFDSGVAPSFSVYGKPDSQ